MRETFCSQSVDLVGISRILVSVGAPELSDLALNLMYGVLCLAFLLKVLNERVLVGTCILGCAEYVIQPSQQFYLVLMLPVGLRLALPLLPL